MIDSALVKSVLLDALNKALRKLTKLKGTHTGGHTGLVQVQRTVSKKGTTFVQTFWIKPDQVKDTDMVLNQAVSGSDNTPIELVSNKASNTFFGSPDEKESSFGEWVHGLLRQEAKAVFSYTTSAWYKVLNKFLRNKPRPTSEYQPNDKYCSNTVNDLRSLIGHLDNAIAKFELKKPIRVHRQMKLENFKDTLQTLMKSNTKMFVDPAFVSTTTVKDSYSVFAAKQKLNLEISVPAGKGVGAWVSPIARHPGESEFLLPRSCVYQVETDLSKVNWEDSEITLKVKLVGVPKSPPSVDKILNKHQTEGRYSEEPDDRSPLNLNAKIGKLVEFQMNYGVTWNDSTEKSLKATIRYNLLSALYKDYGGNYSKSSKI